VILPGRMWRLGMFVGTRDGCILIRGLMGIRRQLGVMMRRYVCVRGGMECKLTMLRRFIRMGVRRRRFDVDGKWDYHVR
jgi:hypothetical protein